MNLEFDPDWRFMDGAFPVSAEAARAAESLVEKVASASSNPKEVYETVKRRFGAPSSSSNLGFAQHDMGRAIRDSTGNAPLFLESLWLAFEDLRAAGLVVPSVAVINRVLGEHGIGFRLEPPHIRQTVGFSTSENSSPSQTNFSAYALGAILGEGAYGQVYEARRETEFGAFRFAIKFHQPSAFVASTGKARERFSREVRALQKLQHRGIVQYLDAGVSNDGRPFLAMPFIDGKNLSEATPLGDTARALHYVEEMALALAYAHSHGVLHRDLKPRNVLVRTSDDQPVILDFGLAYMLDEALEQGLTSAPPGTPGYIPPEVYSDPRRKTPRQDVYACGVILYELIAGRRPSSGTYEPLADLYPRDPKLRRVDRVIRRALAPEEQRIQSAEDLRGELRRLAYSR